MSYQPQVNETVWLKEPGCLGLVLTVLPDKVIVLAHGKGQGATTADNLMPADPEHPDHEHLWVERKTPDICQREAAMLRRCIVCGTTEVMYCQRFVPTTATGPEAAWISLDDLFNGGGVDPAEAVSINV